MRKFIAQEPYDKYGILQSHWSDRILHVNIEYADKEEQWDSQSRKTRWRKWLEKGIDRLKERTVEDSQLSDISSVRKLGALLTGALLENIATSLIVGSHYIRTITADQLPLSDKFKSYTII